MDFDQMFEAWRAQNTAPPYDVNRDALRQALEAEGARVRREMRTSPPTETIRARGRPPAWGPTAGGGSDFSCRAHGTAARS